MANANFLSAGLLRFLICGIVLATTAIVSTASAAPTQEPLKIFVLAGQSNMEGHAESTGLPPELLQPQKDVLFFQNGAWVPLQPGKTFGPEITFGQAMAQHFGGQIGLIKLAVDGSTLDFGWSPDSSKSFYAKLVNMVKAAQKSRPTVIMGMIWMQGAADAKNESMAQAYQKNLVHLIETARKDFDNPILPFVCGRIGPHDEGRYPYNDIVRKAQESVVMPGYCFINCDDLGKSADGHYNAQGQQDLGKRFAAAMIELLNPARPQKKVP